MVPLLLTLNIFHIFFLCFIFLTLSMYFFAGKTLDFYRKWVPEDSRARNEKLTMFIVSNEHIRMKPFDVVYVFLTHFSVAIHIETSNLFCRAKQMTGFYMKGNTELKWLTHFSRMFSFYTPWTRQKTFGFRGYRNETFG